jgi:hypothetical protein
MAKEKCFIQMEIAIKEHGLREKEMAMVHIASIMALFIMDILRMAKNMDQGLLPLQVEPKSKQLGHLITCREKAESHTVMEIISKVFLLTLSNKDKAFIVGKIPLNIKASSKRILWKAMLESSMDSASITKGIFLKEENRVKAFICIKMVIVSKESGSMTKNYQAYINIVMEVHLRESSKEDRCRMVF